MSNNCKNYCHYVDDCRQHTKSIKTTKLKAFAHASRCKAMLYSICIGRLYMVADKGMLPFISK